MLKDLHTSPTSSSRTRYRPVSLPVYLDYKRGSVAVSPACRRHPSGAMDSPSPSPQRSLTSKSPFLNLTALPRFVRSVPRTATIPCPTQRSFRPQQNESRCLQMLIHGLFVAFEDDFVDSGVARAEDLRADGGRPFTHYISLSTRHSAQIKPCAERKTGAQKLKLRLPRLYSPEPPTPAEIDAKVQRARDEALARGEALCKEDYFDVLFDEGEASRFTSLDERQLLAVRDFLYESGLSTDENVRVLLTTPRDHRTDAMAAVLGYLSLVLGHRMAHILHAQDNHPRILSIWKDSISRECIEYLEDVSRLS